MSSIMSDEAIDMLMAMSTGDAQKAAAKKYPGMANQFGETKMMRPLKPSNDKPNLKKPNVLNTMGLQGVQGARPTAEDRTRALQKLVIDKFKAAGLDPAVGLAIISHESNWDPTARSNPSLPDEKYGGAYGLSQMLLPTAQALGYKGDAEGLKNPATNIEYLAKLVASNKKRVGDLPADLFAAHNSGKAFAKAPSSTRDKYVPAAMKHYEDWASKVASLEPAIASPTEVASASTAAQQQILQNGGSAVPR